MFDVKKVDAAIENISEKLSSLEFNALEELDIAPKMTAALAELIEARSEYF